MSKMECLKLAVYATKPGASTKEILKIADKFWGFARPPFISKASTKPIKGGNVHHFKFGKKA